MVSKRKRAILPSQPDALVDLAINYFPPRDYGARWGHRTPCHEGLQSRFMDELASYADVMRDLTALRTQLRRIPVDFDPNNTGAAGWIGGPLAPLDTALLYYFLKRNQPSRYVEIGSGVSTAFAYRSKIDNLLPTAITAIDPQPRVRIAELCDQMWRQPLECVDVSLFEQLWPGDVVFVDGSHRSLMNSDATVFFLDVLPRLRSGVLIGIHNVFLPDDYPPECADNYWNEQYLLAAFLLGAGDRVNIEMPTWIVRREPALYRELEAEMKGILPDGLSWSHGTTFWFSLTQPLLRSSRPALHARPLAV